MSTSERSCSLEAQLKKEIVERGAMPFSRFMELALYDSARGYYASGKAAIGKAGDFYTNVSVGAVFGKILCEQFEEAWKAMGEPSHFVIAEQGAANGQFAADVLEHAREHNPAFFSALTYRLIEPLDILKTEQQKKLSPYEGAAEWFPNLSEMPEMEGVFFCNELVDAFPVELVQWDGTRWNERRVEWREEEFYFVTQAVETPALRERLKKIPEPRATDYHTEINLGFEPWMRLVAQKLQRGCALICDYGYPRDVYYSPERHEGTLSCYSAHRRSYDPLTEPGMKDITAHVDFTSLAECAADDGLAVMGFSDQCRFLTGAAENFLKRIDSTNMDGKNQRLLRTLSTLLHPEIMGRAFHYLGLRKETDAMFTGFKHTPNGIRNLEMKRI